MALYELLQGKHHAEGGLKIYKKGEMIESERDLAKTFPQKFRSAPLGQALPAAGSQPSEAGQNRKAASPKTAKAKKVDKEALKARGKDVTEKFSIAGENGFKVFKRENLFHVFEEGETAPLVGGEGLKEDAVEGFIKAWLEE